MRDEVTVDGCSTILTPRDALMARLQQTLGRLLDQRLGEVRKACREATERQRRVQAQFDAAQRWHYPSSVDVQRARQQLLEANGLLASAQLTLWQAEADAGVWGT